MQEMKIERDSQNKMEAPEAKLCSSREETEDKPDTLSGDESIRKRKLRLIAILPAIIILIGLIILTRFRNILPTTMRPFDLEDKRINHAEKPYTISGALNVTIGSLSVLFFTIMWFVCEGRLQKPVYRKNTIKVLATVYFTMLGACFMIVLVNSTKNVAGHLRPYFIAACKPNETLVDELKSRGTTWVDENMSEVICTSKRSQKYRWSFPSGHSAEAWYAMTLSILLVQYTQNIADKYAEFRLLILPVKATLQFLSFTFASATCISRTYDYHHHWWDVLAGSLFGVLVAVVIFYWFLKPVMESTDKPPVPQKTPRCEEIALVPV
ncbi:uncharacterized protein LOC134819102 [Bolinopsis microptera]|uniref:uncharacterized protein LOC134819102 n=1 Tax=Bolinopsis microptera TaxID=2820187 RepID=UPI00307AD2B7